MGEDASSTFPDAPAASVFFDRGPTSRCGCSRHFQST